ncbi:hypothetical protein [Rhizohabitans arisaemae]|uniref:hypothetical protein n=1 Tax=Rhizohabitans arisaemae TaxID=2720610 RepID=UPI0024B19B2E|nr:hypothetical protein [Rhizohabitans arisaemae]
MNELIAGYANYASTEAILREQQVASRERQTELLTVTVTVTVSFSFTVTATVSI